MGLAGCAMIQTVLPPKTPATAASPAPPPAKTPVEIRQQIAAGNYRQALETYKEAAAKDPQDKAVMKEFENRLEDMHTKADRAATANDYAAAGKIYQFLWDIYPDVKDVDPTLSFTRNSLTAKLENCKTALYQRGFTQYREGHLTGAIGTWQDYLTLDPDNTDIQKALATARTQQKNLRP